MLYWMILVISPTCFVKYFRVAIFKFRDHPLSLVFDLHYLRARLPLGRKLRETGAESHRVTWTEATPPDISKAEAPPLPFSMCVAHMEIKGAEFHWQLQSTSNHQSIVHSDVKKPGITRFGQGETIQIWVCLKIGYTPNYSHLVGIMIINYWV